jgi:hypothetical protein
MRTHPIQSYLPLKLSELYCKQDVCPRYLVGYIENPALPSSFPLPEPITVPSQPHSTSTSLNIVHGNKMLTRDFTLDSAQRKRIIRATWRPKTHSIIDLPRIQKSWNDSDASTQLTTNCARPMEPTREIYYGAEFVAYSSRLSLPPGPRCKISSLYELHLCVIDMAFLCGSKLAESSRGSRYRFSLDGPWQF